MRSSKKGLIIFIHCLFSICAFAQSQASFDQLIEETNKLLLIYEGLNAYGSDDNYIALKETGLSKEIIKSIQSDEEYEDGISADKDSIAEYNLILEVQELIIENLDKIIAHDKIKASKIEELIDQNELMIVQSDDGKLYNFTIDEKTGGSYRSRISKMYFTELEQQHLPRPEELASNPEINPYAIFDGDGFNEIYSIKTKEGTKYLLIAYIRGCTSCFGSSISLVKFEEGIFYEEFLYSIDSRSWEDGINYDHESKKITIDYITDDLTSDCNCNNFVVEEIDYSDWEDVEIITKKCHCTFEFNGLNFELIKESWEKIKE